MILLVDCLRSRGFRSLTISASSTILSRLGERTGMCGLNELLLRLRPGDWKINATVRSSDDMLNELS